MQLGVGLTEFQPNFSIGRIQSLKILVVFYNIVFIILRIYGAMSQNRSTPWIVLDSHGGKYSLLIIFYMCKSGSGVRLCSKQKNCFKVRQHWFINYNVT